MPLTAGRARSPAGHNAPMIFSAELQLEARSITLILINTAPAKLRLIGIEIAFQREVLCKSRQRTVWPKSNFGRLFIVVFPGTILMIGLE